MNCRCRRMRSGESRSSQYPKSVCGGTSAFWPTIYWKVLVIMNNDPADDPNMFAGKRRLYYGRWDYKYEMAAKQGAAGAIIIHTTPSAGYPWTVVQTSWSGGQSDLRGT